jgi:hypothetical protein
MHPRGTFDPLDRRPLLRRMYRAGWTIFIAALGLVVVYFLFAWWYSTLTPTVRVSGEEGWRRAVLFDTTAEPSYPKFIELLERTVPDCDSEDCTQNWLHLPIKVPAKFLNTGGDTGSETGDETELFDEEFWRNDLVEEAERATSPTDAKWQLGAWLIADAQPILTALRPLLHEQPFGLLPRQVWPEREADFFDVGTSSSAALPASIDPSSDPSSDFWAGAMDFCPTPSRDFLLEIARILILDARYAANDGDGRRAAASLIAAMEAADRVLEPGTLFVQATAAGIRARVWQRVAEVLRANPESFDDATLEELARVVAWVGDGPLALDTRTIRAQIADQIQRSFTDDGKSAETSDETRDGWMLTESTLVALDTSMMGFGPPLYVSKPQAFLLGPLVACFMPSRADFTARVNRAFDEIEAESKKPLWERAAAAPMPSLIFAPGDYLVEQITGVYARMANRESFGAPDREAARIALAAERFRRAEGRAPQSLEELVPRFLPEIPRNATSGKPITSLEPTP